MDKKYIIPVLLLLVLGSALVLLPRKKTYDETLPEKILERINSPSRFLSAEVIADRMVNKDPSLLLIDVRPEQEYKRYTLPEAVNIPLKNILMPENIDLISREGYDFVLISNSGILADQAWILFERKGFENIFVLKGGLNQWFQSFFLSQPPQETASQQEIDLYQFRMAVRQYFTGGESETTTIKPVENIVVKPRVKKSAAEGGC